MVSNTEIVWVYGSSGSGKETFIRHIIDNKPTELLKRLGWLGKKLQLCSESVNHIAQFYQDPVGDKRGELLDSVFRLAQNENSVVLIKGQDLDLKHKRLIRLREKLPERDHKIIFLHANIQELYRRWHLKSWWEESFTEETVKEWLVPQIESLERLSDVFEITSLESDAEKKYKTVKFPPKM
jgi:hypothetical protein